MPSQQKMNEWMIFKMFLFTFSLTYIFAFRIPAILITLHLNVISLGQVSRYTWLLISRLPCNICHFIFVNQVFQLSAVHFKDFIYFQREEKEGRKRWRETSFCERNMDGLPLVCSQMGTWPTTHACALTGNQTSDLLVCRLVLNPLSHSSQGDFLLYILKQHSGKELSTRMIRREPLF